MFTVLWTLLSKAVVSVHFGKEVPSPQLWKLPRGERTTGPGLAAWSLESLRVPCHLIVVQRTASHLLCASL